MILSSLGKYRDAGLLLMRIVLGAMFIMHGWPKVMGGPEKWAGLGGAMGNLGVTMAPTFWGFMAAISEFGGGICLVLGFAFRPACVMMGITMAVALTMHLKGGDGIEKASHAIEACGVFLGLLFLGPGKYSIDKK
ncbi:MAG TPA: DoxX family protein [Candidatus Polarisedimenticolia bacterium]|nr:DoxX family protein [Candidatus Polarisedimenticolia bacterium]